MTNNMDKTPKFKNEDEERDYWAQFDLSKHVSKADFSPAVFANLKPSSRSISIRIPEYLLNRLKEKAHALSIPYQTLIKQFIAKGLM